MCSLGVKVAHTAIHGNTNNDMWYVSSAGGRRVSKQERYLKVFFLITNRSSVTISYLAKVAHATLERSAGT